VVIVHGDEQRMKQIDLETNVLQRQYNLYLITCAVTATTAAESDSESAADCPFRGGCGYSSTVGLQ